MKVAVTGGAGFIGSHLTEILLARGCEVTVIDNFHTGLRANVPSGALLMELDIRDTGIQDVFDRCRFDMVVHLAAQTMVSASVEAPRFDADVNILGTVNILEACRKFDVRRVVFSSTAAVYGDNDVLPLSEEFPAAPTSFYGLSKVTVEKYLELYHRLYGLDYVVLRFANVYGPRQGDGGQTRDFIYVGDIAAGIYQALLTERTNTTYNLSANSETSVNELVGALRKLADGQIDVQCRPPRAGDIYRSTLSNAKAVAGLDCRPQTELADGLARTYDYFAATAKGV